MTHCSSLTAPPALLLPHCYSLIAPLSLLLPHFSPIPCSTLTAPPSPGLDTSCNASRVANLCPQVVGPAKNMIIFTTEYLLWISTWNMSLSSIVRNIREHFCSTKTDLSDTEEDHDGKVNQCTACRKVSHIRET